MINNPKIVYYPNMSLISLIGNISLRLIDNGAVGVSYVTAYSKNKGIIYLFRNMLNH